MKILLCIIAITVLVVGVIALDPNLRNLSIPSPAVQTKNAEPSSTVPVAKSGVNPNDTGAPPGFRGPSGPPQVKGPSGPPPNY